MKLVDFIKYLLLTILISMGVFFSLRLILPLSSSLDLFWFSLLGFTVLSVLIYFLVERSLFVSGGKGFLGLVVFNVMLKLVFSFGFVALYVKYNQPRDKFFLVSFFIAYLTFTIFETWFLNLQARSSK